MSKGAINFSSNNEYWTPKEIVDKFGKFDYDPATTPKRAALFGIPNFDTIDTDGLKSDWTKYERIWINPPFDGTRKSPAFGSVIIKLGDNSSKIETIEL